MDRVLKPLSSSMDGSSSTGSALALVQSQTSSRKMDMEYGCQPQAALKVHTEIDLENLPSDPGLRPHIMSYPPHLIEQVRRTYLLKGPCQPRHHDFPQTIDGNRKRKFVPSWFDDHKTWLEYSIVKDAVFCLYCYLYSSGSTEKGHDAFVSRGFNSWRKKERLRSHVGDQNSDHNKCKLACQDLMNQTKQTEVSLSEVSDQSKIDYRCRLNASIVCLRYLILQGLTFQGNDESGESLDRRNFIELLKVLASSNNDISLENAHTFSDIQKDIINAAAVETTNAVINDIGCDFFSLIVVECRDKSVKEQLGIILRYVNKKGFVIERFVGLLHVSDITAISLENAINSFFSTYGLNMSSLRGQGYDGTSNMSDEFNDLKSLILTRSPSAYLVHCFAHPLQLTIVDVAKRVTSIGIFFNIILRLCNVVGGSCKSTNELRESQREKIIKGIASDEMKTRRGWNQEMALKQQGDTRWNFHYGTFINLMHLFASVVDVLEYIGMNGNDGTQRAEANDVLEVITQFQFVFVLHLMKHILGITHELSQVLQSNDQDIVNALNLVNIAKMRLQVMRENGWEMLVTEIAKFCSTNEIVMLNMEDEYIARGRRRRDIEKRTNLCHYRVEVFYAVIDMQVLELNQRFDEVNTELLLCMSCFDPRDSFRAFDARKLLRLAKFYPSEFSGVVLDELVSQLENFIFDMRMDGNFSKLSGIGNLAQKMVSSRKHDVFPLVYLLIKLSLTLPVAAATVERVVSTANIIKNALRDHMGGEVLNDCFVPYIEKDVFVNVTNDAIVNRFLNMKNRKEML